MAKNYTQKRTGPGGGRDRKLFRKPRPSHGPFLALPQPPFALPLLRAFFPLFLTYESTSLTFDLRLFPSFPFSPLIRALSISLLLARHLVSITGSRSRADDSFFLVKNLSLFFSLSTLCLSLFVARVFCANWYYGGTPLESKPYSCMYLRALPFPRALVCIRARGRT